MAGEKTEKATPKRKQDERKKGNIFQSHDVVVVFSVIIMFYSIKWMSPHITNYLSKCIRDFFALAGNMKTITVMDTKKLLTDGLSIFMLSAMPLLLISSLVAVVLTGMQTKMLFSGEAMRFKASRISPLQGFKRMFSMRSVVEVIKAILKICVLGWIIYNNFLKRLVGFPRLLDMSVQEAVVFAGEGIMSLVSTTAMVFVLIAGFDYFYQWWDYEKNLRMSKQEIKEEYKQTEGDPQIKGKIKEKQQQMAQMRMMQNVPNADVVIRNPTHFAVAIQYDPEKNRAPVVIAKGADRIAFKIIEIAEEHNVVITENRPLARGLYEAVELNREIPDEFYQAVAGVLAFVYSLKKKDLK
ncbi:flagellar biosynthetic protein FlhB [Hydrogenoanaerobacterium saccharovorans]|uniref:Flagellar biosynthetic protein FlhB n=1 Tax=Hydrogenoanaerobacterium saccharovorans TaxID=474960 RepID=A0A1H7ZS56_9FIRM|nr:flagellar biosynthesis protein FlhB [Hydrogenoanaerobacterium saccharovorans]RPF48405.1 flagellar biosynthetic protein FlhB [Hydrogenoanaerobacterium saccharovorans]SEM61472.1 flagellar biosynthetic protein FlhB [Hydrogenoanaerobacterium saccharovorans]